MRTRTDGGWIGNDTKDESGFSLAVWHLGKSASLLSLWKNQAFYCLDKERRIGTRSGRAGPPFSARPEKEAKGAVLHGTSAAERSRHVKNSSANLPKLSRSRGFRHMGRFVFALRAKIPSRATQSDSAGAASAFRKLLEPQAAGSTSDCETIFFSQEPVA